MLTGASPLPTIGALRYHFSPMASPMPSPITGARRVLFVCLGNICRSPLAEVVFADLARREGVTLVVDSAGTAGHHAGELADRRARACALRHGLEVTHRSRPVVDADFGAFDLIVAMDQSNYQDLRRRAPASARAKIRMLRDWDPAGPGDVPDPYYGTDEDFDHVWHLCDRASPGLLAEVLVKEKRR